MHTKLTSFWQGVSTGWSNKPHVRSSSGTVTDGRKEEKRGDAPLCDRNMVHKILCVTGFVTVAVHNLFSLSSISPLFYF